MSSKHLQTGDPKPAFDKTKKFRIYSMKFCPFAQVRNLLKINFQVDSIFKMSYSFFKLF